jgi:hypothetical protein
MDWQFVKELLLGVFWSVNSITTWIGFAPLIFFFCPLVWGVKMKVILKRMKFYALYILPWFIMVSVILTSYSMYENKQQQINGLQEQIDNINTQTDAKTKQDIRNFLEAVNPEILHRIDSGAGIIAVRIDLWAENRLKALRENCPNFNKYLFFMNASAIRITNINTNKDIKVINQLNKENDVLSNYYLFIKKDKLIKEGK